MTVVAGALAVGAPAFALPVGSLPCVVAKAGHHALIVDGAPYLILGAQANNSSNWPAQLPLVWPAIETLGANTLEIPVSWEQTEPVEGEFDFNYVDTLLDHRSRMARHSRRNCRGNRLEDFLSA